MTTSSSVRHWPKPAKKKRGLPPYLTTRDQRILKYIWLWKIASTASIHEMIGRPRSPYSTYKTLERLEKNGFVECRHNPSERFHVWQLTERAFNELRPELGDLAEEGYLSENHHHDRLVQAFQLGEWATHQLPKVLFFTEQEMRRYGVENYPTWTPATKEHKPDGYTRIVGVKRAWTIAYEVEISAKSLQRLESVMRFYKQVRAVDRVIWLVGSPEIKDLILRAKACAQDESANYHVFVDLKEFEELGWDAQVSNERSVKLFTLREKYQGICGDFAGEMLGFSRGSGGVSVHLQNKKVLGKSRT